MSAGPTKERDLGFDLLRGLGVLYIVGYYHIQDVWVVHLPAALAGWLARVALCLFCFISGYLLCSTSQVTNWVSAKNFYVRRILRIYPLYFLTLLGFLGAGLIPSVLFLPSAALVNTIINWNLLTLWFVSMIFLFYLLTPLYLFRPGVFKTCLLTTLVLLVLMVLRLQLNWIDPRLFANFLAFAFGILLAQAPQFRSFVLTPSTLIFAASALTAGLLFFLSVNVPPQDSQFLTFGLTIAWFFGTLPGLFAISRWLKKIFPAALIRFIATSSFVLYLIHRLVFNYGADLGPEKHSWPQNAYYVLVLLPIAAGLGYFIQIAYDRLISRTSQRGATPPSSLKPA